MNDALDVHTDVCVLDALDAPSAAVAMRKEREGVARDLIEDRVAVTARKGHTWSGSRSRAESPTLCLRHSLSKSTDARGWNQRLVRHSPS